MTAFTCIRLMDGFLLLDVCTSRAIKMTEFCENIWVIDHTSNIAALWSRPASQQTRSPYMDLKKLFILFPPHGTLKKDYLTIPSRPRWMQWGKTGVHSIDKLSSVCSGLYGTHYLEEHCQKKGSKVYLLWLGFGHCVWRLSPPRDCMSWST